VQSQQVVDALALHWDPISAGELAAPWNEWDPVRVADLVGGSVAMSLTDKTSLARSIAELSEQQIGNLMNIFETERRNWIDMFRCESTVEQVRSACQNGYMDGPMDVEGARDAALALDAPELPAVALIFGLTLESSEKSLNELRVALPGTQSPYLWFRFARLLEEYEHGPEEIEAAYRRALEIDPTYAEAWNHLCDLLETLERCDDAVAVIRRAVELVPTSAATWVRLGRLFRQPLKRYDDAEAAFRKAIELDRSDAFAATTPRGTMRPSPPSGRRAN
jgi:tetratricopeptide (TPR) repeat protein